MGPKKKLGHEFPHGQTALSVPSDNQKTMSRIDPGGRVGEYGWREGGLPVITHARRLWLVHDFPEENLDTANPPMLSAWGQSSTRGTWRHRPHRY